MEVNYPDVGGEGYMGSMQWQLGREMGTIPAFASRTQENQENLGRDGSKSVRWTRSYLRGCPGLNQYANTPFCCNGSRCGVPQYM